MRTDLQAYTGTDKQVCSLCKQNGDDERKPIRYLYKDDEQYFQYLCCDCSEVEPSTKPLTLSALKAQSAWGKKLKLAALNAAIDAAKLTVAGVGLNNERLAAICSVSTGQAVSQQWINQQEFTTPPEALPTQKCFQVLHTSCVDFSGCAHHFLYWHCQSPDEASVLGLVNHYEARYDLLGYLCESIEESKVMERWEATYGQNLELRPQLLYELILEARPALNAELTQLKTQSDDPKTETYCENLLRAFDHVLSQLEGIRCQQSAA